MSKKTPAEAPLEAPTAEPVVEYPKMLYIGPYRQQVTVCTAEDEARWMETHDGLMDNPTPLSSQVSPQQPPLSLPSQPEAKTDDGHTKKRGSR